MRLSSGFTKILKTCGSSQDENKAGEAFKELQIWPSHRPHAWKPHSDLRTSTQCVTYGSADAAVPQGNYGSRNLDSQERNSSEVSKPFWQYRARVNRRAHWPSTSARTAAARMRCQSSTCCRPQLRPNKIASPSGWLSAPRGSTRYDRVGLPFRFNHRSFSRSSNVLCLVVL